MSPLVIGNFTMCISSEHSMFNKFQIWKLNSVFHFKDWELQFGIRLIKFEFKSNWKIADENGNYQIAWYRRRVNKRVEKFSMKTISRCSFRRGTHMENPNCSFLRRFAWIEKLQFSSFEFFEKQKIFWANSCNHFNLKTESSNEDELWKELFWIGFLSDTFPRRQITLKRPSKRVSLRSLRSPFKLNDLTKLTSNGIRQVGGWTQLKVLFIEKGFEVKRGFRKVNKVFDLFSNF